MGGDIYYLPLEELFIGEFNIASLIMYNMGDLSFLPELIELDLKYIDVKTLPPFFN